VDLQNVILR